MPVENPFTVSSIHGFSSVKHKCMMRIFGLNAPFFLLNTLSTFGAIIGFDSLTRAGVALDFGNSVIKFANSTEKIKFFDCENVKFTKIDDIVVPSSAKRIKVFSTSNEALTFNTSVIATIRTKSDEPAYSRLYPYPMGAADFVNNEIKELLSNGIIRPSRSPYNSPTWVVDKKGTDDNGIRKKRLVIDFRKLNEQTIADRYPMPSIPMILANLGKAKYFTTLDLK